MISNVSQHKQGVNSNGSQNELVECSLDVKDLPSL